MISDCFLEEKASLEILTKVTSFCSECYESISQEETIFYDLKQCRYVCNACQKKIQETLDSNCNPLNTGETGLF